MCWIFLGWVTTDAQIHRQKTESPSRHLHQKHQQYSRFSVFARHVPQIFTLAYFKNV